MTKYIMAVSGTHGTGKSTVIRGLDAMEIPVLNAQISRMAQTMLGWDSLSKAQESVDNMWALQDTILTLIYDRDMQIAKSKILTVVERSPADLWAYTKMWCHRLDIDLQSERVILYKNKCRELTKAYRGFFMLYPSVMVPFQAEEARADLASRDTVQHDIEEFLKSGNHVIFPVAMANKEQRIATCASYYITEKVKYGNYH